MADDQGVLRQADIYVTGLAGFLLAKTAAAYSRRKPKDWYDIAYVLLNNDQGDPVVAARRTREVFGARIASAESALRDLVANFAGPDAQGTRAYVEQTILDQPGADPVTTAADSQVGIQMFCDDLLNYVASLRPDPAAAPAFDPADRHEPRGNNDAVM